MSSTVSVAIAAPAAGAHRATLWTAAILAAAAAVLFALHRPLAGGCYGFVDDYVLVEGGRVFPDWPLWAWVARDGRPLYGLILNLALQPVGGVCDLALVRLLNLGLEAAIAAQLYALAARSGWPRGAAAAAAAMLVALPGFAVATAWATLIGPLVAIVLALAAASLATTAAGGRPGLLRLAAAACLLALALAIYQPGAMAFVPGVAIALVRRPATRETLRDGLLPAALVLVAVVAAYAVFFLLLPHLVPEVGPSRRTALTRDPWAKLLWFIGVPLRQAQNLFNLQPVPRFGYAVAGLIVLGAFLRQGSVRPTMAALAVQGGAVALAFLPNLVVAESWPSFRASLPMAMTIAVLVAAALVAVGERIGGRWGAGMAGLLVAMPAVWGLLAMSAAADRGIVRLQREEWAQLVGAVRPLPAAGGRLVALLPAGSVPACARWQRFDEFGLPSTARPWAAAAMLRHAWIETHGDAVPPRFHVVAPGGMPPPAATVIDMASLLAARSPQICDR
ncbi:MAG: glucosyltransferase domain-containing protein [Alphaproteobacteria bacterium]|nr:glucosyltransferase domain-containing protein [Alphaproteobacteria bacterium]